jgi:GrpB-like predicted nucleotidyltransferase (UPF0157 family)
MSDVDRWSCLGTPGGHIEVVPWCSQWPALFEEEAERIRAACGDAVIVVEHIGSTSVPGLASKPILDIMPGLVRTEDGHRTVEPMKGLGYEYFGEHGIPGRFYFDRKANGATVIHVHVFELGSPDWRRHIVFRDVLRANPSLAAEYQRLKLDLAVRFRNDRKAYTDAKTGFIASVVTKAAT